LTVLEYVKRHHVNYEVFIGLKKGSHPWHAVFNRIYKLSELIDSGFKGWVLYLDADSYICDLDFDVLEYLGEYARFAFIFATICDAAPYWNINDGVFFANLGHPVCVNVVRRWRTFYDRLYSTAEYAQADKWDMVLNDQTSLHGILRHPLTGDTSMSMGVARFSIRGRRSSFAR